jgi:hypothetical protein
LLSALSTPQLEFPTTSLRTRKSLDPFDQSIWLVHFTFPNCQDSPSGLLQPCQISPITINIRKAFRSPELLVRRGRDSPILAIVNMKEATMHVDDFSIADKDDVGFTKKVILDGGDIDSPFDERSADLFNQNPWHLTFGE